MGTPMEDYRECERQLTHLRELVGLGGPDEAAIQHKAAAIWWQLSETERAMLDAEGPTCFPAKLLEHAPITTEEMARQAVHRMGLDAARTVLENAKKHTPPDASPDYFKALEWFEKAIVEFV